MLALMPPPRFVLPCTCFPPLSVVLPAHYWNRVQKSGSFLCTAAYLVRTGLPASEKIWIRFSHSGPALCSAPSFRHAVRKFVSHVYTNRAGGDFSNTNRVPHIRRVRKVCAVSRTTEDCQAQNISRRALAHGLIYQEPVASASRLI